VVNNAVFQLWASPTLFNARDLCFILKENCCTKAAHLACWECFVVRIQDKVVVGEV
jgi:hypothetical protein